MKRIVMTVSVFVEDDAYEPELSERGISVTQFLYDHICDWDGNTEGTVDVLFDHVEENVSIGDDEIFETVRIK
jgi:hypothetical protein